MLFLQLILAALLALAYPTHTTTNSDGTTVTTNDATCNPGEPGDDDGTGGGGTTGNTGQNPPPKP